MNNVGRNDPCPCGSGLKYKKCCLGKEAASLSENLASKVMEDIHRETQDKNFASMQEANVFLNGYMKQRNDAPLDDFKGISPNQMHSILHKTYDSPDIVTFPDCLNTQPSAPIVTLFQMLVDAIGEQGLKPTATGNLPRKFLRESALAYWGEARYKTFTEFGDIRTEPEFPDMHATHIVAGFAGLIRKYDRKIILSRECRKLISENGMAGVYPRLLRAHTERFNWGYQSRYPEIDFVQQSFLFTLYLLDMYGGEWRTTSFYEDMFLQAFPNVLKEVEPAPYHTQEEVFRSYYSTNCLRLFAEFMGLVEVELEPDRELRIQFKVRKLPLLNEAVIFHLKTR